MPSSDRLSSVLATTWVGPAVFLAALAIAAALFSRRALLLFRLVAMGKPVRRFDDLPRRLEAEAVVVLGQRKIFQRLLPGFMHAFIFWGFLVLLTTIVEAVGEVFDPDFAIPWIGHSGWLALVQDVFAVLVLVGLALAVYIRKIQRPERFKGSHLEEADFILVMIFGIILTLFLLEAAKIALGTNESPAAWSPVANALSPLFTGMSGRTAHAFEQFFLYAHLLLVLAFLAYIPFSKHLHIFVSAINVFFENTRPSGTLRTIPIDLEAPQGDDDLVLGAGTVEDLTWKQRLDLYSCTECGRCQSVCPAWNTGKPLSPKLIVMNLRDHLFEQGPQVLAARKAGTEPRVPLNPDVIEDEVVWDCTTCGACMRECPVDIEHVDHIVDMRRNLVMAESRFPAEAGTLLRNLEGSSNPWGQPQSTRADWANGLGVRVLQEGAPAPQYLYWVGCAGSFDDRARRISQAVARVLQKAAMPFAILGPRELCTGDPARRIGNEYLFQELAKRNVETLTGSGVRTVITNCPHCFNTLRNEYPDLGGRYEVIHHTQLFARLVREGRLRPDREVDELLAYHDPCYLGRHNGVYDEPRAILDRIPALRTTELPRHRERGFCCGAGGSRMWLEERIGKRVNMERTEEAIATGADTLGVACPYCLIMLDDGAKASGDAIKVEDVAQVVARATGAEPEAAGRAAPAGSARLPGR